MFIFFPETGQPGYGNPMGCYAAFKTKFRVSLDFDRKATQFLCVPQWNFIIYLIMNVLWGKLDSKTSQEVEKLAYLCILMALTIRFLILKRCVKNYLLRENSGVFTMTYLILHKVRL